MNEVKDQDQGTVEDTIAPPRNVRCFVCLGRVKDAEEYLECPKCGRIYHKTCARRIKACPMCDTSLGFDEDL